MVNLFLKYKFLRYLLVVIQIAVIVWFSMQVIYVSLSVLTIIGVLLSGIFGIWAIVSMKLSTITALPDPRKESELTTKGPYSVIRHPMYTSVLIYCTSFLIQNFNLLNTMILIVLILVLVLKMYIEEHLLKNCFPKYLDYSKNTWRVIPFVF